MKERRTEIFVGLAVTIAILLLILSVIWGKGIEFFSHRNYLTVRFDNVRGLEKGDPVVIRGIKQGKVVTVKLDTAYAEVRLWIRNDIPLFSDLRIVVEDKELMGGKQVNIDPGKNRRRLDNNKVLYGEIKADMGELIGKVGDVLTRMDTVLVQIENSIKNDRLNRIVNDIEEAANQTKKILVENRTGFHLTVERLEAISQRLQQDSTAAGLGTLLTRLDSTVILIKQITIRMEREDGTLGKLLRDRWLYDQLLKTSYNLDSLITDIKRNPKKYINVSLF